ncbi:hypothetical protein [Streptomyces sp. RTGN2]|uniref:hypothetical protein n=1 Tax=Streptomyces sp. RTGN2 TaxID=3016525 RepID=UPI002555DA18|nr:hypothetical protein [Streptomyces sp. RTGN2]
MRTAGRTGAVVAVAGALALVPITAPTAQAADTGITVSRIVVNGGRPVVVGTHDVQEPPVTFRITLPSGYSTAHSSGYTAEPFLYHDTTPKAGADAGGLHMGIYTCYETSSRIADCEGTLRIDPYYRVDSNNDATTWKVAVVARLWKTSGGLKAEEFTATSGRVQIKRWARATVNASPEPVTRGKTLTVTGGLARADWVKHKYTGVAAGLARLQFCKKGSSVYTTVKSVRSSSTGALRTTVKASADGYWRWSFGGWDTTGGATSTADYVDVR